MKPMNPSPPFFPAGHPAAKGPMLTLEQQMLAALQRIEALQERSASFLERTAVALEALVARGKPTQAQTSKK